MQNDITDVIEVCVGRKKPTNYHRSLMTDLSKGVDFLFPKYFIAFKNNIFKNNFLRACSINLEKIKGA